MPINIFSKENREKQKQLKEIEKQQKILDQAKQLSNPPKELPVGQYISQAALLHPLNGKRGWIPKKEVFWRYVYALGFQSLGYLDLAKNVHLIYKYQSGHPKSGYLTWMYAAERASILAERAQFALKKLPSHPTIQTEKISKCLDNIIAIAAKAKNVSLEDAKSLRSACTDEGEVRTNFPIAYQGWIRDRHIRLIGESEIPNYLQDEEIGAWLKTDINSLETPVTLVDSIPFQKIHFSNPGEPIRVFCEGTDGKSISLGFFGGTSLTINLWEKEPVKSDLKLKAKEVSSFSLFLGQFDIADMDKWDSLAILEVPDIGASSEVVQVKLVFEISQECLLNISALDKDTQTNLGIFRAI